jgi:hypothetical protein
MFPNAHQLASGRQSDLIERLMVLTAGVIG